ncbi:MAG: tetratricopeptide repeat protein [Cyanobacteria bacterium SZAS-4]|nr:tetratricopeptide repeat protein [Cyanobacteria bacterium SZAS-4]
MNKNFQAQILSAMLVLSAASTTVAPAFAADNGSSTTIVTTSVQKNDTALMDSIGVLLNAGDIKGAYEAVNKAIQANSQNATAYLCKSWVLYADYMDLNKCLEPINQAIAIAPDYVDAHMSKASVLKMMNDWRGAAKEYDVVISLDPTNESAMNSSIACKADLGDWSGLIENFKVQIANDPTNAQAYFNKAYCEAKLGARDAAIADYQQAEKLFVAANDTDRAKAVADELADFQKSA